MSPRPIRYSPTSEQTQIIEAAVSLLDGTAAGSVIRALAGAGTGKTSTLIYLAERLTELFPGIRILYLAYNRDIKTEAQAKFGRLASCYTTNGFAFRAMNIGRNNRKLGSLYRSHIAKFLSGRNQPGHVDLVYAALNAFYTSPLSWPDLSLIPRYSPSKRTIPVKARQEALTQLGDLLDEVLPDNETSSYPIPHDLYLKFWQMMGSPGLSSYDLVMLDEAQDANPVILSSMNAARRAIYVGDSHQAIYQWRDAVDSLRLVSGRSFPITQSFRFGPEIAALANTILDQKVLKPDFLIHGNPVLTTSIGPVPKAEAHTRIYRTNLYLLKEALLLQDQNVPFIIEGNLDELEQALEGLVRIRMGQGGSIRYKPLRHLKSWAEVEAKQERLADNKDIALALKVIEQLDKRAPEIVLILRANTTNVYPRLTLTTAHKSKGREWDNVVIAADFDEALERAEEDPKQWDAEMNLLYVAVTRAMARLDIRSAWLKKLTQSARTNSPR